MRKRLLVAFLTLSSLNFALAQSVPFPTGTPPYDVISPWGYNQVGTSFDTSPFRPFIYQGVWFRLMPPNGVTYNASTNTWNFSNPTAKYPLIFFNPGAGERGTDNNNQLKHGGQIHRDAITSNKFPGWALYWQTETGTIPGSWFAAVVNRLIRDMKVDPDRVYTHGLSRGGAMTWYVMTENPKMVAAAFPMSSSATIFTQDVAEIPVRLAQGGLDTNPLPVQSQEIVDDYKAGGGNLQYYYFPTLGHNTWNTCYVLPDFFQWFLSHRKNDIHVFYGITEVCPGDPINIKLGLTGGFDGYEWRFNGNLIAGATQHTYNATQYGTYTARFRRAAVWTEWSAPVEIKVKQPTQTPPIVTDGLQSRVLPAPDGKTTVTLALAPGFDSYTWKREGQAPVIGTAQKITVGIGSYVGAVTEIGGCSSVYSPAFVVADAAGPNPPDPISNLHLAPVGKTAIELTWENVAAPVNNETGFEIYRSLSQTGPYTLLTIKGADQLLHLDQNLTPGVRYYYIIRPVNNTAAAAGSFPASIVTGVDEIAPTAPRNLAKTGSNATSVSLSWNSSSDDLGVVGYDIFVNGLKAYTTTATSFAVNGLVAGQLYNFVVKARDAAGNVSQPSNQVTSAVVMSGLNYKYYHGDWDALPNFPTLSPVAVGWMANFALTPRLQNDYFAFSFTGRLNVTTGGNYTFYLNSDDGSKLYIDGVLRCDNDGLHGTGEKAGTPFALSAGVHDIKVEQFEKTGGEALTVRWSRPGMGTQNIPNSALTDVYVYPATPPTPGSFAIAAMSYQSINLTWTPPASGATSIEIQQSLNNGSNNSWANIAIIPATQASYLVTGLTANTRYYYRIRSIGPNGESVYSPTRNTFTLALPPIPTPPTNLAYSNVTTESVDLAWSDNSNNETGFEISRSAITNTAYQPLITVTGSSYVDTTLVPHTKFFYKVRAKNVAGNSGYTNEIEVNSANSIPVLTANTDTVVMRFDEVKVIALSASDADDDDVFIEGEGNPGFSSLFDYGEGAGELFLEPTAGDEGVYDLEYTAKDAFGGTSPVLNLHVVINNNHTPVINDFTSTTAKETYITKKTFRASDVDAGDQISWSFTNLPSFITTTSAADSIVLEIEPQENHQGVYNIEVIAEDQQGAKNIKVWQLTVEDFNASFVVRLRLGPTGAAAAPAPWNSFLVASPPAAGSSITNLTDQNGRNSGFGVTLNTSWDGAANNSGMPSGIYPGPVMLANFSTSKANGPETITISGLVPNHKYSFDFFGSRNSNENRTTLITINGVSSSYNATQNTSQIAEINNVSPNANGQIVVTVAAAPAATNFGYLNSIIIESFYDGKTAPVAPSDLTASFATSGPKDVVLNWSDNSSNEFGFEIYKSVEGAAFTKIATTLPSIETYVDVTTSAFVSYAYTIRAINGNGNSAYTDTVSIVGANNPPVIAPIPVISVAEGQNRIVQLTATDADGGPLTFSLDLAPSFVSISDVSNGVANLTIAPLAGDAGTYTTNVMVFDDQGDLDYKEITIVVSDFEENYVYVNFGGSTASGLAGAPWNNTNIVPNGSNTLVVSNLKDNFNVTTSITLTLASWNGSNVSGAVANGAGIYPDPVILSSVWHSSGTKTMVINGLKPDYLYDFDFLGSRALAGRTTTFSVAGLTPIPPAQDVSNNISRITRILAVRSNAAGQITINVAVGAGGFAYMNAMVLREYSDSGKPNAPLNLNATVLSRNSMRLNWTDLSDNEAGFEIYRSASDNLHYALVATTIANATTYIDGGLTQNTKYYYKIRAKKDATSFSNYSNETSRTTYNYQVSVNLGAFNPAPSPWNNYRYADLDVIGETRNNLLDDLGTGSGIALEVVTPFLADDNTGVNTGNNSGVVPDAVLEGHFYIDPGNVAKFKLKNLSFLQEYTIGFIASKAADGDRTTKFQIGSKSATFNCARNTQTIIYLTDLTPDPDGSLTMEISLIDPAFYGYLSGFVIQASTPSAPGGGGRVASADFENGENTVDVYPNPFEDRITISSVNDSVVKASLMSTNGKTIALDGKEQDSTYTVDLKDAQLSSGLYIMQVKFKSGKQRAIKVIRK